MFLHCYHDYDYKITGVHPSTSPETGRLNNMSIPTHVHTPTFIACAHNIQFTHISTHTFAYLVYLIYTHSNIFIYAHKRKYKSEVKISVTSINFNPSLHCDSKCPTKAQKFNSVPRSYYLPFQEPTDSSK